MNRGSLQLRLLFAGLAAMVVALVLAGFVLTWLFERHVERRAVAEAEIHLRTLIAGASLDKDSKLLLASAPADPQFGEAYGGLYWQVQDGAGVLARSRSLWDAELALPADHIPDGGVHIHDIPGPRKATLLAVERGFFLTGPGGALPYRIAVAVDRKEIVRARNDFIRDLAIALGLLGLALGAAFVAQVRIGLQPLKAIRDNVLNIRAGKQPRLAADFPTEVMPLADEINILLDERDAAIEKARGRAADLAHGLKTPLTALNGDVRRLREAGQARIADEIESLGAIMQRHVQRELARARLAGRSSALPTVRLRPIVEGIAAAVARTPAAQDKAFDLDVDADTMIEMDRADLEEMIGNLMENAARHARGIIRMHAERSEAGLVLMVEDDGAGVGEKDIERLMQRGVRLDLSGNGAGLGFSIVKDVVMAYGGTLTLGRSSLGGLRAEIRLA